MTRSGCRAATRARSRAVRVGLAVGRSSASQAAHAGCGQRTTRSTKMPGVTTTSGSSRRLDDLVHLAIVVLAAVAITGPKLRAVLR